MCFIFIGKHYQPHHNVCTKHNIISAYHISIISYIYPTSYYILFLSYLVHQTNPKCKINRTVLRFGYVKVETQVKSQILLVILTGTFQQFLILSIQIWEILFHITKCLPSSFLFHFHSLFQNSNKFLQILNYVFITVTLQKKRKESAHQFEKIK
jgi:hypothetical protein